MTPCANISRPSGGAPRARKAGMVRYGRLGEERARWGLRSVEDLRRYVAE